MVESRVGKLWQQKRRLGSGQIKKGLLLFGFYPKAWRAIRGYYRGFLLLF